jgi:hypothetical protein
MYTRLSAAIERIQRAVQALQRAGISTLPAEALLVRMQGDGPLHSLERNVTSRSATAYSIVHACPHTLNGQFPYVRPTNLLCEGLGSSSAQRRNVTRELLFFMFRNNVEDPLWKIESKVT